MLKSTPCPIITGNEPDSKGEKELTEVEVIVQRMKVLEDQAIENGDEKALLWERFLEIADDISPGEAFRHADPDAQEGPAGNDGWVMERVFANNSPTINAKALEDGIGELESVSWVDVTDQVRTLSQPKLQKAAASNSDLLELIKTVTTQKSPTLRKSSKKPTKDDMTTFRRGTV